MVPRKSTTHELLVTLSEHEIKVLKMRFGLEADRVELGPARASTDASIVCTFCCGRSDLMNRCFDGENLHHICESCLGDSKR